MTTTTPTYDIYTVSFSGGQMTYSGSSADLTTAKITDLGGNTSVLGDVSNDSFDVTNNFGTSKPAYDSTYIGIVTYNLAAGGTAQGFLSETSGGTYYLFTLSGAKPASQTATPTLDNTSDPSTQWNLSTGSANCFCAGTMIATPGGAVPVESLAAGDLVLTAEGRTMPVRWLGRTTVSRLFADPQHFYPVRIKAGALGENLPARDLRVSPGHGIRIGDVLAHASALVNGTSIVREQTVPFVFTYYHVELDTHALVLAEGVAAETFLEDTEAMGFDNWDEREAPAAAQELAYPRVKSSRQLPRAVRETLAKRATTFAGPVAEAA